MRKYLFPMILILLSVIAWLVAWPYLPSEIATHWNAKGEVNGYSSRFGATLIMNGLLIFLYFLFLVLPKVDPKKNNYRLFSKSYTIISNTVLVIFFILSLLTLLYSLGYPIPMAGLSPFIVGAIFIVLGNFMQTIRPNFFLGVRTPWTISNENVWRKTHRLAGKFMFIAGIIIILSVFFPDNWESAIIITCAVLSVGIPACYSYWVYKNEILNK
ncbi:putative membrane protein [Pullulanibacillus pueri]|uniref:Immunity protein SdpI n=1 Tax=Pullulanibacillus pueri TaxID=1437324 RepID=A0A8J2ZUL7_9BACL|nr:SdpI family protein [Pullulanibacillus pueri]MBM7681377.1 putative membrane protein [Pullulanibacillus pueri]GGH78638.1 immunity protein SdpI [Pullulanibacillus pueri]